MSRSWISDQAASGPRMRTCLAAGIRVGALSDGGAKQGARWRACGRCSSTWARHSSTRHGSTGPGPTGSALRGTPSRQCSARSSRVAATTGRRSSTSSLASISPPSVTGEQRPVVEAGCPAEAILYVGDRLDNDVKPAQAAGIATAFLRRGLWAYILRDQEALDRCLFRLDSLAELPDLVAKYNPDTA